MASMPASYEIIKLIRDYPGIEISLIPSILKISEDEIEPALLSLIDLDLIKISETGKATPFNDRMSNEFKRL